MIRRLWIFDRGDCSAGDMDDLLDKVDRAADRLHSIEVRLVKLQHEIDDVNEKLTRQQHEVERRIAGSVGLSCPVPQSPGDHFGIPL